MPSEGNKAMLHGMWQMAALAAALLAGSATTGPPNGSFELGATEPTGWVLEGTGSRGGEPGSRWASVTGSGADSGYWRTQEFRFAPNAAYRLTFRVAAAPGTTGGAVIAGPSFCNRDFRPEPGWHERSFVFISPGPDPVRDAYLRLGQWHVVGEVRFDDVSLSVTRPIHSRYGTLELGEGETVEGNGYSFQAPLSGEGTNFSRPLASFTAGFNTNRWTFGPGQRVVYRHAIGGVHQQAASVRLNCNYHTAGSGAVEASADGRTWVQLGRFDSVGSVEAELPPRMFPAGALYVRIRSVDGSFQVDSYAYEATLARNLGELVGATAYPDIMQEAQDVRVELLSAPAPAGQGERTCRVRLKNLVGTERRLELVSRVSAEGSAALEARANVSLGPRAEAVAAVPCALSRPGTNNVQVELREGGRLLYRAGMDLRVPPLYDSSYGHALPSREPVRLWWCESARKVSRTRAVPEAMGRAVELSAARNEYEAVQLVLRPERDLADVRVSVSDLAGPGSAALAARHITVRQVAYVKVTRPTDAAGCRGHWPDPLPPWQDGQRLEAGFNYPLWVTVHVPEGQPAGDYEGNITVEAAGWQGSVPLRLRVYDFTLPRQAHLQTAFGLSTGLIRRFHNLGTTEELRQVLDLYWRDFAAHRISPYTPAPLDPIRVELPGAAWEGGVCDTADPRSGTRCLKVADSSETASVSAQTAEPVPIDPRAPYRLRWWVKTLRPGQPYLVSLQQYDADGQWIPNFNVDCPRIGTGEWQREEQLIPAARFSPRARAVRVALRPAPWSEAGEATGTAWFDDLSLARAEGGPNLLPSPGFEPNEEEFTAKLDFSSFDRQCEKCLDGLGFNSLMIRLRGMPGGTFHARRKGRLGPYEQGSPEYERLMASQGRQIVEHLRARGWLSKAYVYWFDEPEPKDYPFVIEGMELLKRAVPGLTRMLTEQPEPALFGHVDLWCPTVGKVAPQAIAERKAQGERFWWYLCTGPKAPYIGLFIDRPAVDLRVWAWLSRKWGVEGHLVWSSNYWTSSAAYPPPDVQNPWQDPMSYVSGYSYRPGQIGYWGNGDGRFLYPPNRDVKHDRKKYLCGPVDSIRWEMLRDGTEDYEYFWLLDDLIRRGERAGLRRELIEQARAVVAVPDAVIVDDHTYSKEPGPLLEHRAKLAAAIERLSRALGD